MGLFDLFKKQPPARQAAPVPASPLPPSDQPLLDIAAIISNRDPWVMEWMDVCVNNTSTYAEENYHRYVLRGLELEDDPNLLQWLGMVDILTDAHHVCERDWKDELPDFLHFLKNLEGTKRRKLPLDKRWLDPGKDVSDWIQRINSHWAAHGCCLSVIDINSDSYVLFPCTMAERAQLKKLAAQLGQRIE